MDCLKDEGNVPDDSERLTIVVIVGASTEMHCLSRDVGMGSSSHCLDGDCMTILVISLMSAGRKCERIGGFRVGFGTCGDWLTG